MPDNPLAAHAGKLVGVLGGGQLGLMLGQAGTPHGLRFRFLDPSPKAVAQQEGEHFIGKADDMGDLERFAGGLDCCTFEFENVDADGVGWLAERIATAPNADALRISQDRLTEKRTFGALGIPTPAYRAVDTLEDLELAAEELGLPMVVKTRRLGYDGKGQAVIGRDEQLGEAWEALAGRPLIAEAFVPFTRELSVVAARGRDGHVASFPLVENKHRGGILRRTVAPAPDTDAVAGEAAQHVMTLLTELDYVGVAALELFEVDSEDGPSLMANEMAPRVHNSGHWSMDGAGTSQFEQHLLALLGEPLGDPKPVGHSVMVNLIGDPPTAEVFAGIPSAYAHLYGKDGRPGRKVGHVTVVAETAEEAAAAADRVEAELARWAAETGATVGP